MHRYVVAITFSLLGIALVTAVVWLSTAPSFEAALTCLTLLATVTGLFIDRWVTERERRQQLLHALVHELYMNLEVLKELLAIAPGQNEGHPRILPRFYIGTLGAVISSGAFASSRDKRLWKLLHNWLQRSTEANIRLQTTEHFTLTNPNTTREFYTLITSGKVMKLVSAALNELTRQVIHHYSKESGIDKDTILFDVPNDGGER